MTRDEIFAQAAQLMRAEFKALSVVPHHALRGGEAEDIIRRFLSAHIPKRFAVGSGFILDPLGVVSRQTDVVIYDAFNCPVYRASETAAIFPSNNVAVVIEVKSTLDKAELADAWEKIAAIKKLAKNKADDAPGVKAQTMGFVFAFASKSSLAALCDNYHELFRKFGIGHHVDAVFVLDYGFLTLACRAPKMPGWGISFIEAIPDQAEGTHVAISVGQTDEYTLDAFMRLLLPQLIMFRPLVDHPGFRFDQMPIKHKEQMLTYMTTFTAEKDEAKRVAKVEQYAKQATKEFEAMAAPPGWGKKLPGNE